MQRQNENNNAILVLITTIKQYLCPDNADRGNQGRIWRGTDRTFCCRERRLRRRHTCDGTPVHTSRHNTLNRICLLGLNTEVVWLLRLKGTNAVWSCDIHIMFLFLFPKLLGHQNQSWCTLIALSSVGYSLKNCNLQHYSQINS